MQIILYVQNKLKIMLQFNKPFRNIRCNALEFNNLTNIINAKIGCSSLNHAKIA